MIKGFAQMKVSKHCLISGRVQGVFYRSWLQKKAIELAVTGWTQNLSSGEVECVLSGDSEAVEALIAALWKGPMASSVSNVVVKEAPGEEFTHFDILR